MADLLIAQNTVPAASADLKPASGTPQFATSGNPSASVPATVFPAYAANMILTELYNIVLAAGITPSGSDWSQTWQALLRSHCFVDSGTVNAIRVALPNIVNQPNTASVFNTFGFGVTIKVKIANTNTSPTVTLNAFNIGPVTVVRPDGSALQIGDLPAGQIIEFVYDGTRWVVSTGGLGFYGAYRPLPTGGLTVYVRSDGSDNNNGFANTSAGAYKTIEGAIAGVTGQYNLQPNRTLTIILGLAGTYTPAGGGISISQPCTIVIKGATASPSSYIIQGGNTVNQDVIVANAGATVALQDLTIRNVSNIQNWVSAVSSGTLNLTDVNFTQAVTSTLVCINAAPGGSVLCYGPTFFTSITCGSFYYAHGNGSITLTTSSSATWSGSNTATTATAQASDLGYISVGNPWTATGTVTGKKFLCQTNGGMNVSGLGVSIFPGTTTGNTQTGGFYI